MHVGLGRVNGFVEVCFLKGVDLFLLRPFLKLYFKNLDFVFLY